MNETQSTRPGEAIDTDALASYLKSSMAIGPGDLEVAQFPGGSSNLTYLVRAASEEFVLRRPPYGNTVKTAHDMSREFNVLSRLCVVYPPAPKPLLFCGDESIIGSEFYIMERRRGVIIRGRVDNGAIGLNSSCKKQWSTDRGKNDICRSFIDGLARLHSIDPVSAGLGDLGKPDGYCRRQVEGWTKRYDAVRTSAIPGIDKTIVWLSDNIPDTGRASLLHNDYKFDNVMLDPSDMTVITAVLDWEMVTVGDPLMDLGTTLGYWISADAPRGLIDMPFNPRVLMEGITRRDLVDMYAEAAEQALPDMLFYYVFGTFKIAVIAQQIYARYAKGFTSDARFAHFDHFVTDLGLIADQALERGTI